MSTTKTRKNLGYSALLLLFVGFVVAVVASNLFLRGMRVDSRRAGMTPRMFTPSGYQKAGGR